MPIKPMRRRRPGLIFLFYIWGNLPRRLEHIPNAYSADVLCDPRSHVTYSSVCGKGKSLCSITGVAHVGRFPHLRCSLPPCSKLRQPPRVRGRDPPDHLTQMDAAKAARHPAALRLRKKLTTKASTRDDGVRPTSMSDDPGSATNGPRNDRSQRIASGISAAAALNALVTGNKGAKGGVGT